MSDSLNKSFIERNTKLYLPVISKKAVIGICISRNLRDGNYDIFNVNGMIYSIYYKNLCGFILIRYLDKLSKLSINIKLICNNS